MNHGQRKDERCVFRLGLMPSRGPSLMNRRPFRWLTTPRLHVVLSVTTSTDRPRLCNAHSLHHRPDGSRMIRHDNQSQSGVISHRGVTTRQSRRHGPPSLSTHSETQMPRWSIHRQPERSARPSSRQIAVHCGDFKADRRRMRPHASRGDDRATRHGVQDRIQPPTCSPQSLVDAIRATGNWAHCV